MNEAFAHEELYKRIERMENKQDRMSEQISELSNGHASLYVEFRSLSESITRNWAELSKKLYTYNETLYGNGKPGLKAQMSDVHRIMGIITAVIIAVSCKVGYDFYRGFTMIVQQGQNGDTK